MTLWDTKEKKRVPGSSYKGDLNSFLARNPHMEVYNRQDEVPKPGQQLMAGQKISTIETSQHGDHKVVMWHLEEHRKLRVAESPTQSELHKFLRANPQVVVYDGQDTSASSDQETESPSVAPSSPTSALLPALPTVQGEKKGDPTATPPSKALKQPTFRQLATIHTSQQSLNMNVNGSIRSPFACSAFGGRTYPTATSASKMQMAQLQALLRQKAPTQDALALLQAAQMVQLANLGSAQLALASTLTL